MYIHILQTFKSQNARYSEEEKQYFISIILIHLEPAAQRMRFNVTRFINSAKFYNSKSVISQCMSAKMSQVFCSVSSNSCSASLVDGRESDSGHGKSSGITEW